VQKRRPVGTLYQRLEGGYQSWLGDGKDVWLIETYVTDPQSILSSGWRTLAQAYRRLAVKTKLVPGLLRILEVMKSSQILKSCFPGLESPEIWSRLWKRPNSDLISVLCIKTWGLPTEPFLSQLATDIIRCAIYTQSMLSDGVLVWLSICGVRCRLAYGPADVTATHCLLLQ